MKNYSIETIKSKLAELKISKAKLAQMLGDNISGQRIGQYIAGKKNPKNDFWEIWDKTFNETNVSHETKSMQHSETGIGVKETFYQELIERNEEYSLIPRAVLKDYKIVPDKIIDVIIASGENEKKAIREAKDMEISVLNRKLEILIEEYERDMEEYNRKIKTLEEENASLRTQIPPKDAHK